MNFFATITMEGSRQHKNWHVLEKITLEIDSLAGYRFKRHLCFSLQAKRKHSTSNLWGNRRDSCNLLTPNFFTIQRDSIYKRRGRLVYFVSAFFTFLMYSLFTHTHTSPFDIWNIIMHVNVPQVKKHLNAKPKVKALFLSKMGFFLECEATFWCWEVFGRQAEMVWLPKPLMHIFILVIHNVPIFLFFLGALILSLFF